MVNLDLENLSLGLGVGVLGSIIAGFLQPSLRIGLLAFFIDMYTRLSPHETNLTGHWTAEFTEPHDNGILLKSCEEIDLRQRGTTITATGTINTPGIRKFNYNGQLINEILWGKYENIDDERGAMTGKGVFLLELSKDRRCLKGYCAWVDRDTQKIETSDFEWKKK